VIWDRVGNNALPACLRASSPADRRVSTLLDALQAKEMRFWNRFDHAGAVLLRGFDIESVESFSAVVSAITPATRHYSGGDARRHRVGDFVYTANDAAGWRAISPHNEMGYSRAHPDVLFFYCAVAAASGGETPLTDGRQLVRYLDPAIVDRFRASPVVYVSNLPVVPGGVESAKTWQATFETTLREHVEAILDERNATWSWSDDGTLHIEETVPAIVRNRFTEEEAFFCQADRWHASQYRDGTREDVLRIPAAVRYHHCRFASGAEMIEDDLVAISAAKQELSVKFTWQRSDVLCVDNR